MVVRVRSAARGPQIRAYVFLSFRGWCLYCMPAHCTKHATQPAFFFLVFRDVTSYFDKNIAARRAEGACMAHQRVRYTQG